MAHIVFIVLDLCLLRLKSKIDWSILDLNLSRSNRPKTIANDSHAYSVLRCLNLSLVLLSVLLSKPHNIPVIAFNILMEKLVFFVLESKSTRTKYFMVIYLTLALSGFYSTGNSNTISTIDVSSGYVGLTAYNPLVVGVFILVNTYSIYMFWITMLFVRLHEVKISSHSSINFRQIRLTAHYFLTLRTLLLCLFQIIAVFLQNHLFIWSVICPKLLYESSLCIFTSLLILLLSQCAKLSTQ